ncbi:MAG: DUF1565 domain-containing protein [Desulfobacteraceae bacterium]
MPPQSTVLQAGTTSTTLAVTTDEDAECRYAAKASTSFEAMSDTFSTTGLNSHSTIISGLSDGNVYTYYVRCRDTSGNANTDDYSISFSVNDTAFADMQCISGAVQSDVCTDAGLSGTHTRTCNSSGVWGSWSVCTTDPLLPPIEGDVYYVSASGPDIADDADHGSDDAPWRTIQYAVNQLGPNDTLMIRRGYYSGSVTVNVSGTSDERITIRSEIPHSAKVNGGITVNGNYVTIYGLDVEQPSSGTGIIINESQGVEILTNQIHDCPMYGINVASTSAANYTISGNTLSYNGQIGMIIRGDHGTVENNKILEVVAFHPKLSSVDVSNGDDADGMVLRGTNHVIRRNLIANYSDPLDSNNYYLPEPIHNAHADCFDIREVSDITIEGNYCWSNFHVSKGIIFNGSGGSERENITIRNNIFEYRDVGIRMHAGSFTIRDAFIYNNLLKSRIDDVIDSYLNPGSVAHIPGDGISLVDVTNHVVFNNITVDCDNHTAENLTGNPIKIDGGTGVADYNFSWNSDGAGFSGASPGEHGSLTLDPTFETFDSDVHGENDYRLQASSPIKGLGTAGLNDLNNDFIEITDDIDGLSRPQESSYEPGPYEYSADTIITAPDLISTHVNESALELTPTSCEAPASPVSVEKARWQGNKQGALIIRFDDGTPGHALCGLEAFGSRGLTGTWYFNPGRDGFTSSVSHPVSGETIELSERWNGAPSLGQELANHTMNHTYETDADVWRSEVEEASNVIWGIRHGLPLKKNGSLIAFNNSSSVAWPWEPKEQVAILSDFSNVERQTYMGPPYHTEPNRSFSVPVGSNSDAMYCGNSSYSLNSDGDCVNASGDVVLSGVNRAISNGVVYQACFHGILSTDSDNCDDYTNSGTTDSGVGGVQFSELETFLDRVAGVRDQVWVAGAIELYKYTQEVQRSNVRMHQACSDRIYFDVTSPLGPLYDEPLTLIVTVPDDWTSCTAMQGEKQLQCTIDSDGTVLIDVIPNNGRIALLQSQ